MFRIVELRRSLPERNHGTRSLTILGPIPSRNNVDNSSGAFLGRLLCPFEFLSFRFHYRL